MGAALKVDRFDYERIVFGLSVIFLGVPFLGPWVVTKYPVAETGLSLANAFDSLFALGFAAMLAISLAINLAVFVRKRATAWDRPLPRRVANAQATLLALIVVWILTLLLNAAVFGHPEGGYFFIWLEALGIIVLSICVCAIAVRAPEPRVPGRIIDVDPITGAERRPPW